MACKYLKQKSVDALLADYRKTAARHGAALEDGPPGPCNRAFDKLTRIRHELRARGPEYHSRLRVLLNDENPAVRRSAAVDALVFAPDEGARVLRDIASGPPGLIRHDAAMVLKLWEAGEWNPAL